MKICSLLISVLVSLLIPILSLAQEDKLTTDEVVQRHIAAIGTDQARAVPSRVVSGTVTLFSRIGGSGNMQGVTMMASLGPKFRFGTKFNSTAYPGDDMAFNGQKAKTGFLNEGQRSNLSLFLNSQEMILRDGLLGGVLSTAWPLLRLAELKAQVSYRGLKKLDGRQVHELLYRPNKNSSDLRVTMYFDAETFRHWRTKYDFEIAPRMGQGPNESARQMESRYQLLETFDDFRTVDGLTLPHQYKLQLSIQAQNSSVMTDWVFEFKRISHQQKIEADVFELN